MVAVVLTLVMVVLHKKLDVMVVLVVVVPIILILIVVEQAVKVMEVAKQLMVHLVEVEVV